MLKRSFHVYVVLDTRYGNATCSVTYCQEKEGGILSSIFFPLLAGDGNRLHRSATISAIMFSAVKELDQGRPSAKSSRLWGNLASRLPISRCREGIERIRRILLSRAGTEGSEHVTDRVATLIRLVEAQLWAFIPSRNFKAVLVEPKIFGSGQETIPFIRTIT